MTTNNRSLRRNASFLDILGNFEGYIDYAIQLSNHNPNIGTKVKISQFIITIIVIINFYTEQDFYVYSFFNIDIQFVEEYLSIKKKNRESLFNQRFWKSLRCVKFKKRLSTDVAFIIKTK